MTCPKCGKELIIGSTLCPDCDVLEQPPKPRRKLSKRGKKILAGIGSTLLLIIIISVLSAVLDYRVVGTENGNGLNLSYAAEVDGDYYFSDGTTLYGIDSRFKNKEVIDKGSEIYALNEFYGTLYYVKDNVLCRYSPGKRVKAEVIGLGGEDNVSVIGKSKKGMYFQAGNQIKYFDIDINKIYTLLTGEGVIGNGRIYVFSGNEVKSIMLYEKETESLCQANEFEKPVFVSGRNIFCINYKEMTVFTINCKSGERKEIFNCKEHNKISDVTKLNFDGKYLYFTGTDGIYKYNIKKGEISGLLETGHVGSICIENNRIFSRRFEGTSYFSDLSGKILYFSESVE